MSDSRHLFRPIPSLLLALSLTMGARPATADELDIVVVTHDKVGLEDISTKELSRLFLALSSEVAGLPVKAVNLDDAGLKYRFLNAVSGMSERDVDAHFVTKDLRGEAGWPPEVATPEALAKLIITYKKAVGWMTYAQWSELPERTRSVLRVLSVDGMRMGEPAYPLKP